MSEPRRAPRFTGVRTFAGLAHTALEELFAPAQARRAGRPAAHPRAVVVGVPFDTATSWRAGARFGPEAIRSASALLRPFHAVHGVQALAAVTDAGDVAITPGNAARSSEQIAAALAPVCRSTTVPLVLGGDHLVALGELRAQAAAHGALALVLLDAHADTWEDYYGERLFHGTVLRRAVEEGLVDPERSLIAGLRGSVYAPDDLAQARTLGFELVASRVRGRAAFLSFDIDFCDPSVAPGTGTPEIGGPSSAEAAAFVRALAGVRLVGADVVEVAPAYDSPGQITALLAANVAYEMLALSAIGKEQRT